MLASRKPLAIALVLVVLFALLAPAATAAPEWTHGVDITAPTQATPAYIKPPAGFNAKFDLTIVGTQVDDVEVRFRLVDPTNHFSVWQSLIIIANNALVTGVNKITSPLLTPVGADGWYDFEICARDLNNLGAPTSAWFCDLERLAVLIDHEAPGARLVKPASGAVVSGKDYLMVGKAWDPAFAEDDPLMQYGAIKQAWFEYCAITNFQTQNEFCGSTDQSWVKLGDGTPTAGVPYQYQFIWDSTAVPDDHGAVRFCAVDLVGLKACDVSPVFVVNRFTVSLRPGWNLISTPLMLYDDDMDAVLLHLIAKGTVKDVYTAQNMNAGEPDVYVWKKWVPGDTMKFEDGQGYWINMKAADQLTFVGSFKTTGPAAPPEYPVFEGWNLIGYTHWGQPTSHWIGDKKVAEYLGMPLAPSVEALWRYDAWTETYIPMYLMDLMVKGAGYWLGIAQGGTINP
jgi:hypothetical protein